MTRHSQKLLIIVSRDLGERTPVAVRSGRILVPTVVPSACGTDVCVMSQLCVKPFPTITSEVTARQKYRAPNRATETNMNEGELQKRRDAARKKAQERLLNMYPSHVTYLRTGPMPRRVDLPFEDRLSTEDRELLRTMGIAV